MTYDQLESHFGGMKNVMAKLGIKSRQTMYNWKYYGIPSDLQFRIQVMTNGKLKANRRKPESRAVATT